jgi:GR25 family glycosyltransferase involved in LPS biosynthesis
MKAFVIRLKGIESSESLALDCIDSGKKHGLEIIPFDGIYGQENIDFQTNRLGVTPWKKGLKKGRLGVKGCFLSHYTLWLKSIELNESLIIFEHDGYVLQSLPSNLDTMFDEFLMLDPYNKFSGNYLEKHTESKNNSQQVVEYFNPDSRKKYRISTDYAMGLQAYVIKPKAALKLKHAVAETGYFPADMQCNKGIINIETVTSPIASINKKYYNNTGLMTAESSTQYKW